jgi:hypothetical protein
MLLINNRSLMCDLWPPPGVTGHCAAASRVNNRSLMCDLWPPPGVTGHCAAASRVKSRNRSPRDRICAAHCWGGYIMSILFPSFRMLSPKTKYTCISQSMTTAMTSLRLGLHVHYKLPQHWCVCVYVCVCVCMCVCVCVCVCVLTLFSCKRASLLGSLLVYTPWGLAGSRSSSFLK